MREECEAGCSAFKAELEACEQRVNSRSKTEEKCTQELFDFLHCVDHCVSSSQRGVITFQERSQTYEYQHLTLIGGPPSVLQAEVTAPATGLLAAESRDTDVGGVMSWAVVGVF